MSYFLYSIISSLLLVLFLPFFLLYCVVTRKYINGLGQRFGFFKVDYCRHRPQRIWFHAASVGEVQAAKALIDELDKRNIDADLIISTVTEQGQLAVKRQFDSRVVCLYAPLDLPWIINRFIKLINPTVYICLETELWPNILHQLNIQGITTLLLNGRLSARSCRHYRFIAGFMNRVMNSISAAAVISRQDRERYIALGLEQKKIIISGNAKYDLEAPGTCGTRESAQKLPELKTRPGQIILVAGSTHSGEEEILIDIHQHLCLKLPGLLTIIAPRHLERLPVLEELFNQHRLKFQKFSDLSTDIRTADIILLDYMGILTSLYAKADFIFCGGSLTAKGGHNIMEAAVQGRPPFFGPHMDDFADAAALLLEKRAGFQVASGAELEERILYFNSHKHEYRKFCQAALRAANAQQGAARRQVDLIIKYAPQQPDELNSVHY